MPSSAFPQPPQDFPSTPYTMESEDDHFLHVRRKDGTLSAVPKHIISPQFADQIRATYDDPMSASNLASRAGNAIGSGVGYLADAIGGAGTNFFPGAGHEPEPDHLQGQAVDPPHLAAPAEAAPAALPTPAPEAIPRPPGFGMGVNGLLRNARQSEANSQQAIDEVGQGAVTEAGGIDARTRAESAQSAGEAVALADRNTKLAEQDRINTNKQNFRQNYMDEQYRKYQDVQKQVADTKINPNAYWDSKGSLGKIGSGLAIMLGGLGAGLAGKPLENQAIKDIHKGIEDNVREQRLALQDKRALAHDQLNTVQMFRERGMDERTAEAAARQLVGESVQHKLEAMMAGTKSKVALANGMEAHGKLQQMTAMHNAEFKNQAMQSSSHAYGAVAQAEMAREANATHLAAVRAASEGRGNTAKPNSRQLLLLAKNAAASGQLEQLFAADNAYRKAHPMGSVGGADHEAAKSRRQMILSQLQALGMSSEQADKAAYDATATFSVNHDQKMKAFQDTVSAQAQMYKNKILSGPVGLPGYQDPYRGGMGDEADGDVDFQPDDGEEP